VSVVRWLMLVVFVIAAIPAALFTVQNANWVAQLSLDLQLGAWILKEPMPVPHLMWMSFGVGLLGGMVAIPVLKLLVGGGASDQMDDYGSSSI
jgi:hypothetical protein